MKNSSTRWIDRRTLQLRIFPKAENVSYMALLSILLSKFLMNTFPTPDFLKEGSRWDHIIRIGFCFKVSKFIVSRARSAEINRTIQDDVPWAENIYGWKSLPSAGCWKFTYAYPRDLRVIISRHTRMDSTGPAVENFSNNIDSVTSGCKSPTYREAIG